MNLGGVTMRYKRPVYILSNIRKLNQSMVPEVPTVHEYIRNLSGWRGAVRFLISLLRSDLVILNIEPKKLMLACAIKWALPLLSVKLVSVDLILRRPVSMRDRLKAVIKRLLFRRVHRFILYFKDLHGYERFYGISSARALYVPFKVNTWERISVWPEGLLEESYVLCAGRTLRDVRTFVQAMRQVNCLGLILQQEAKLLSEHGTEKWLGELPPNISLVIDSTDDPVTFANYISKARILVLPRYRDDIAPSGISTYLVAMALKKCVIISDGPGVSDVLTNEAVIVPPQDPERLAEQIELLWNDHTLRREIASRGQKYAFSLQGEERLYADIMRASLLSLHAN